MHNRYLLFIIIWILPVLFGGTSVFAIRLDTTFGFNGRVAVELGVKNSAHAVVVQPDGKIVVAGSSSKGKGLGFSLLRFNKDGSLDSTFNGDGSLVTSVSTGDSEALALGLLSDGRIVAAGYSHNGKDRDFALVCYLPNGARDRTFGRNGAVVTSIGNGNEEIAALTVNSDDMITVAGVTEGTVGRVLVTARYRADGVLDDSFGEHGLNLIGIGNDVAVEGIIERKDGSLVVSGSLKEKKGTSLMLVGLGAEGRIDNRFGVKGIAVPSGSFVASEGYGLTEDSEGRLYVVGSVGGAGSRDSALFRFTRAGKVDSSFGDKGVVVTQVSKQDDVLYAVTIGRSGVIASGYTTDAGIRQFLLVTFASDGLSSATPASTGITGTVKNSAAKKPPIQEVRINGATKVQIRRLQVSSSLADYTNVHLTPSLPSSIFQVDPVASPLKTIVRHADDHSWGARWLPELITRFGYFLMPAAVAAETSTSISKGGAVSAHVVTTAFSEGESVGYAATFDASGNVIVVGTAAGPGASSIVVAQYAAEIMTDSNLDKPGHRSSHITTAPATDGTKTSSVTGGDIMPTFGQEVVKRGVVFSLGKDPTYSGNGDIHENSSSITVGSLQEGASLGTSTAISPVAASVAATKGALLPAGNFSENGETANGAGYGSFVVRLERLKPGTTYFVRAYALTAEDKVYYGDQLNFRTADACFVATASFGSLLHPGVRVLRDFRDTFLVQTTGGQGLVDLYYAVSPPLADWIAGHEWLRFAVRLILLPCIGFAWLAMQVGMVWALVTVVGSATILSWFSFRFCLGR